MICCTIFSCEVYSPNYSSLYFLPKSTDISSTDIIMARNRVIFKFLIILNYKKINDKKNSIYRVFFLVVIVSR